MRQEGRRLRALAIVCVVGSALAGCASGRDDGARAPGAEASLEGSAFFSGLVEPIDAAHLRRHVEILSGACTPHVAGDPFGACDPIAESATGPLTRWAPINHAHERLVATTDYIRQQFEAASGPNGHFRVFEQEFDCGYTYRQKNVIAVLPGWDPTAPAAIVSAHHDSINPECWGPAGCGNWSDPLLGTNAKAPGANDNAAGVAVLLEMARALKSARPRGSLLLIAFAAEEEGRIGSQAYLARLPQACSNSTTKSPDELMFPCPAKIRGVINLDIVGLPLRGLSGGAIQPTQNPATGRSDDTFARLFAAARVGANDLEPGDTNSQHLARTLALSIGSYPEAAGSFSVWQRPTLDRPNRFSDHQTFSDFGIPAVRLMASRDSEVNHTWHDRVVDREGGEMIDWRYAASLARITLIGAYGLADGPPPPLGLRLSAANEAEWDVPAETSGRFVVAFRRARSITVTSQMVTSPRVAVPDDARSVSVASVDARGIVGPLSEQLYVRECPTEVDPGHGASETHQCSSEHP